MRESLQALVGRLRRRAATEDGFTLIELMVAIGIIMIALLVMAFTATSGFSDIALSRQRQAANGFAQQAMEQMRALPFSEIANGMDATDLANSVTTGNPSYDPNITTTGCGSGTVYCLSLPGGAEEQIPYGTFSYANITNPQLVPLIPHQQTITGSSSPPSPVPNTTFTIDTYVSYYCPGGASGSASAPCSNYVTSAGAYRVTVIVGWSNSAVGGVSNQVVNQSVFYSPNGCESDATHPFSSPCQPFFYGTAMLTQGAVQIVNTADNATGALLLPGFGANAQLEQISSVNGSVLDGGLSTAPAGSPGTNVNASTANAAADNDPTQSDPLYSTASLTPSPPGQASGSATLGMTGGTLSLTEGAGDYGSVAAAAEATQNTANCFNSPVSGSPATSSQNDQLPCTNAQEAFVGPLSASLGGVAAGGAVLGSIALASIAGGSGTGTDQGFANYDAGPDQWSPPVCSSAQTAAQGGNGCMHVDAVRYLGAMTFAGLPSSLPGADVPAGWISGNGLVSLPAYTDLACTESIGNTTPASWAAVVLNNSTTSLGNGACNNNQGSYSITYWNGTGYSSFPVSPGAQATIPVAAVGITDKNFPTLNAGTLQVTITPHLTTGGTSTTAANATSCAGAQTVTACGQGASNGPIAGYIHYVITYTPAGGSVSTVVDLQIDVNLGTLTASSTYQAPPAP